jgi:aminopeptidase N
VGFCARFAAGGGSFGLAGVASASAVAAIMGGQYWFVRQVVDQRIDTAVAAIYTSAHTYADRATKATSDAQIVKLLDEYSGRPSDWSAGENPVTCEKRLLPSLVLSFGHVLEPGSAPSIRQLIEEHENRPEVTDADVAAFQKRELPALRDFLNGKPSEAEFTSKVAAVFHKNLSFNQMVLQSWNRYTLLWIFLGVITAYRLAYDRSEVESF